MVFILIVGITTLLLFLPLDILSFFVSLIQLVFDIMKEIKSMKRYKTGVEIGANGVSSIYIGKNIYRIISNQVAPSRFESCALL